MERYLRETELLDTGHDDIQKLIEEMKWREMDTFSRIGGIYGYVQNAVKFGYSCRDTMKAHQVLRDGYGQCNTKSILLMTLLRGSGIPCRLHGSEVSKDFQKGAASSISYAAAPGLVIHTWVEVLYEGRWLSLEGVITDREYYDAVRKRAGKDTRPYRGCAVAVDDIQKDSITWKGEDTFVQHEAVVNDLGVFDDPDAFYACHRQTWGRALNFLYVHIGRKMMNRRLEKIRKGQI